MLKLLFLLVITGFTAVTYAQTPDFIQVKKRNGRNLKTYMAGNEINFYTRDGNQVSGEIAAIKKDSLFVNYYHVNTIYTIWNTRVFDTLAVYHLPFHYQDIKYVNIPRIRAGKRGINLVGTLLQVGSGGFIALNLINSGSRDGGGPVFKGDNGVKLGVAAGVLAASTLAKRINNGRSRGGQKIVYVNMQ